MALTVGTELGPYKIEAPLGAGGMGEVYRARDARLGRSVAIKVVPPAFSRDPDRLQRFQREAQVVAALDHPNILAIHDFGEHEDSPYIVTELLDGETLRQRLAAGTIPVRKAIEYSKQIAAGLAAAHAKDVVHRDLKPENIFITRDDRVKILDFGLAKVIQSDFSDPDAATLPSRTEPGVVMGTAGYMSPEQVRGKDADHRSDLFSFGAVLYEMLSGKRTFGGGTSVEVMNAILKEDPPELLQTGGPISPTLIRIVEHCLEKNPAERFQSAQDVGFALGALANSSTSTSDAVMPLTVRNWSRWLRLGAEVVLLGIALVLLLTRHTEKAPIALKSAILPPPGEGFWANITQPVAISPDGRFLAIIAMRNGHNQLWLRSLDALDAQPIAGSEGASDPFWSPDSREIAFFVPGKLKRVAVSGGTVRDICSAGFGMGGAWSSRGVIVFSTFGAALKRVPENGGIPEAIAGAELSSDALGQYWPAFLPDGIHFLYLEWRYPSRPSQDNAVSVGSLDGEKARRLPLTSTNAQYSQGYLLFSKDNDLVAQKFDLSHLALSGPVLPIASNIEYDTFLHDGMFSVSAHGTLVYAGEGVGVNTELTWLDREGKTLGVLGEPQQFICPSISPDGKRVAVSVKPTDAREKIWIYDVDRGTRTPVESSESGPALYKPIWSPDGRRVAYRSTAGKTSSLLVHGSDGSGDVTQPGGIQADLVQAMDWSSDGRYLAFLITRFQGRDNFEDSSHVLDIATGKSVFEISNATAAKFSPDGHWLAYGDKTSGEIYITPFPGPGARIAVSSGGGNDPRWRGDGQELFYVSNDLAVMAVQVQESAKEFRVLSSKRLFHWQLPSNAGFYDVTRDGKRFLMNARTFKEQTAPLTLMSDWLSSVQGGVGREINNH